MKVPSWGGVAKLISILSIFSAQPSGAESTSKSSVQCKLSILYMPDTGLSTSVITLTPTEPERTYLEQRGFHGDSPSCKASWLRGLSGAFCTLGTMPCLKDCRPIPVFWAQPTLHEVAPTLSWHSNPFPSLVVLWMRFQGLPTLEWLAYAMARTSS